MGGAIAAGVVTAGLAAGQDVCVTHARAALLERLEKQHCTVRLLSDNREAVRGAVGLLQANGTMPQQEIDKVTTPGGITLKGLEAMERGGFSAAVIDGLLASK